MVSWPPVDPWNTLGVSGPLDDIAKALKAIRKAKTEEAAFTELKKIRRLAAQAEKHVKNFPRALRHPPMP